MEKNTKNLYQKLFSTIIIAIIVFSTTIIGQAFGTHSIKVLATATLPDYCPVPAESKSLDSLITDVNIELLDYNKGIAENGLNVQVTDSQGMYFTADFTLPKNVTQGDKLTITLPDGFDVYGTTSPNMAGANAELPQDLQFKGQIIANSYYDYASNKIIYTFTKAAEQYAGIKAGVMQPIFIDGTKVTKTSPLDVSVKVGNTESKVVTITANFSWNNYNYEPKTGIKIGVAPFITNVDYKEGTYIQYIVVNPDKTTSNSNSLIGDIETHDLDTVNSSDTIINSESTKISVYLNNNIDIDRSLFFTEENLGEDVTDKFPVNFSASNKFEIKNIGNNGDTYVIKVEGKFDNTKVDTAINIESKITYTGSFGTLTSSTRGTKYYDNQNIVYTPGSYAIGTEPTPQDVVINKTVDGTNFEGNGGNFTIYRVINSADPLSLCNPDPNTTETDDIPIFNNISLNEGKITSAEFKNAVKDTDGEKYISSDGKFMPGIYYIRETKAPSDNQTISNEIKIFTVFQDNPISIDFDNSSFIEIPIEKQWSTRTPKDKKVPVTIKLLADGEVAKDVDGNVVPDIVLDGTIDPIETELWKGKYTNLPEFTKDFSGQQKAIVYTIEESEIVDGAGEKIIDYSNVEYTQPTKKADGSYIYNTAIVKNDYDEKVIVHASKTWKDVPKDLTKTDVYFQLVSVENGIETQVNVSEGQKNPAKFVETDIEWKDLPKNKEDGSLIEYRVKEVMEDPSNAGQFIDWKAEGFTADFISTTTEPKVDDPATSLNESTPKIITYNYTNTFNSTSVTAKKKWTNVPDNLIKPKVYFQLMKGIEKVEDIKQLLEGTDSVTWENLPKNDSDGNEIEYFVREVNENGDFWSGINFTAGEDIVDKETNTITFENIYKIISITAKKEWDGGPQSKPTVKFQLMNGDKSVGEPKELIQGNTTVTWDNLPADGEDGKPINYTVKEIDVPSNYVQDDTVKGDGTKDNPYIITNKYIPSIKITKAWQDADGEELTEVPSGSKVEIQLLADEFIAKDVSGNLVPNIILDGITDEIEKEPWIAQFNGLPEYKDDGITKINYSVKEIESPKGFITTITGDTETGFSITNKQITNDYKPIPTNVTLEATKVLTGEGSPSLEDTSFEFILTETTSVEGHTNIEAKTVKNIGANIKFEEITYTKPGTYTYEITEKASTDSTITSDSGKVKVEVTVNDNEGKLEATTVYKKISVDGKEEENNATFTNVYKPADGSVILEGTKAITGKTLQDKEFNFQVLEGNEVVATGTNDAAGKIAFTVIKYSAPGSHKYTVKEVAGNTEGITYDPTEFEVTVEVTDVNGKFVATPTYPAEFTFKNIYKPTYGTVLLEGTKAITGKTLQDKEFNFEVLEGDKVVATGTNDAAGKIAFAEIKYTAPGSHTYKVREVPGNTEGITYDATEFDVTVEVTDVEGKLKAIPTYNNMIKFNNKFVPEEPEHPTPSGQVTLIKVDSMNNTRLKGAIFELIQDEAYIPFYLIDNTTNKKQSSMKVTLTNGIHSQEVVVHSNVNAESERLVKVNEEGEYYLILPEIDGYNISYKLTKDQKGIDIIVEDSIEDITTIQTEDNQELKENSLVVEKQNEISTLEAEIDSIVIPEPQYEEIVKNTTTIGVSNTLNVMEKANDNNEPIIVNQEEIDIAIEELKVTQESLEQKKNELTELLENLSVTLDTTTTTVNSNQIKVENPKISINFFKGEVTTDIDGMASLSGLNLGLYYFKEIEAPEDYIFDKEKLYPFEITNETLKTIDLKVSNTLETTTTTEATITTEATTTTETTTTIIPPTIPPSNKPKLPNTGSDFNGYVSIFGVISLLVGRTMFRSKKEKK